MRNLKLVVPKYGTYQDEHGVPGVTLFKSDEDRIAFAIGLLEHCDISYDDHEENPLAAAIANLGEVKT